MPLIISDRVTQVIANKAADLTAKKAGDLALATIHLFTNDIIPSALNVIGDFTEATFTGYAAQPVAGWGANEQSADGSVSTDATTVLQWVGPNDATGETIYGYYILSAGAGTPLIGAYRFPAQVGLVVPTDVLSLVPSFTRS